MVRGQKISEQQAANKLSIESDSLKLDFPAEPTCCIHALEEHLVDWIRALAQLGENLSLREVCNCAQLAMSELRGEPFKPNEWVKTFLSRNPVAAESLAVEEKRLGGWTNNGALGYHETTFKAIVSLVHSLGIYMRKADLTQVATDCIRVLNWKASAHCHAPGISWCRRFIMRHPEMSQLLYVPDRVAAYCQIDGSQLIKTLRPFIEAGRTTLNEVERQHVYSQLPNLPRRIDETNDSVCEEEEEVVEVDNDAPASAAHSHTTGYSFPNKLVRNTIIEDVLNNLCLSKALTCREEMCTAVKIIADLFSWKTIYENNQPSKSWTLRFMSERPSLKQYLEKARASNSVKLGAKEFHEAVTKAIEDSTQAQKFYPEYYVPVE